MTRPRQIVGMVLAGMVMVLMAGAVNAGEPPAANHPKAGKPAKVKSLKQVRPVTVTMSGSACGHHVTPMSERLNKTNRDALGWRIRNNCASAQKVLICAYRGLELFNPFQPCVSNPTTGLDIGKAFTVAGGKRENLDCEAKVLGNYKKLVLVGNEVPSSGCPGGPPLKEILLTHMLDVEILP